MEDNFKKYFTDYTGDKSPVIPRKIHQIWLGGTLPIKYYRIIKTWIELHPGWEYKLWTDKDVDALNLVNKKLYDAIDNVGVKSDILRYEILYRYGGLYIDTDFKCIKPFDDLLYLDFFSGEGDETPRRTYNGLIACKPKHPLLLSLIDGLKERELNPPKNYGEVMTMVGPEYFNGRVVLYLQSSKDKTVMFPYKFFYPFPARDRLDVDIQQNRDLSKINAYITPQTYCVHLWHTSWQWETQIGEFDVLPLSAGGQPIASPPPAPKKKQRGDGERALSSFLNKTNAGKW
jgi:mannosyltransferase OCH1-like enzyme